MKQSNVFYNYKNRVRILDKSSIKTFFIKNKTVIIIVVAVILGWGFLALNFTKFSQNFHAKSQETQSTPKSEFIVFDYEEQKLINQEKNRELAQEQTDTTQTQNKPEDIIKRLLASENEKETNLLSQLPTKDNKVTLNIRTDGRRNPFAPFVERSLTADGKFDIIEPPQYIPDEAVDQDLMKTTVSGILYNEQKSSAIINVNGTDHLVNKGDKIAGFQITNITRNKVFVKKGYNIISAGVGESLEAPVLTYNEIYDLPNKFGGKYQHVNKEVILINGKEY